jgi:hypothetical protein
MWRQPPSAVRRVKLVDTINLANLDALVQGHNQRTHRQRFARDQCRTPHPQRLQQLSHPNPPKLARTPRQIPPCPLHQRTSPHHIPRRVMMQRHRCLNQPLEKSLLHPMRLAPHVLPNLVRVIKLARIKVTNPQLISVSIPRCHAVDSTFSGTHVARAVHARDRRLRRCRQDGRGAPASQRNPMGSVFCGQNIDNMGIKSIVLATFFSPSSLKSLFLQSCGKQIGAGPGKILSHQELHLKY